MNLKQLAEKWVICWADRLFVIEYWLLGKNKK